MKRIVISLMVLATLVVGASLVEGTDKPVSHTTPVVKTKTQPFKTKFLADCESAGGQATESSCNCAYGQLVTLYGEDWTSTANKAVVARIESQGLNQIEVNAIGSCK